MKLTGLHFLLTYQCNSECDHCFVWGGPRQTGVMTLEHVRNALRQAQGLGSITSIYFEGGEPFLYYPILLKAVQEAADMGFEVGLVSNAYWAITPEDALEWLRPFAGLLQDLSVSSDLYHYSEPISRQSRNATQVANSLGIPIGTISVAQAENVSAISAIGQLPLDESGVMYRGRAADKLAPRVPWKSWAQFTECPHEDLREPGRVHLDPFGNLHICQGISIGNLFQSPLSEICAHFEPEAHPITGPLLAGGPTELVRRYGLPHAEAYADACHLCYTARLDLRSHFPDFLLPDQMYGVVETGVN
jgi:Radical SAM superfamily